MSCLLYTSDTIEKYNLDGFDIDYEPGYGHSGSMANGETISESSGNTNMFVFIKTLSDRLRPAGRMLVMDGQPEKLSTEASKYIDHYIYQAYWERSTAQVLRTVSYTHLKRAGKGYRKRYDYRHRRKLHHVSRRRGHA